MGWGNIGRALAAVATGGISEIGGSNSAGNAIQTGEVSDPLKKAGTAWATGGLSLLADPIKDALGSGGAGTTMDNANPFALIDAQTRANQSTALFNAGLNRVNQVGPFGSSSWTRTATPTYSGGTPSSPANLGPAPVPMAGDMPVQDPNQIRFTTGQEHLRLANPANQFLTNVPQTAPGTQTDWNGDPTVTTQPSPLPNPGTPGQSTALPPGDPGQWTLTQTLNPNLQQAWDARINNSTQGSGLLSDLASTYASGRKPEDYLSTAGTLMQPLLGDGRNAVVTPGQVDRGGLLQASGASASGGTVRDWTQDLNKVGYGTKLTDMPVANEQVRQDVINAMMRQYESRLNPQWAQAQSALETKLANQGLTQGSQAWNAETDAFGRSRNDAYQTAQDNSIIRGGEEQKRLFDMGLSARTLSGNEALSKAGLGLQGDTVNANNATQASIASANNATQASIARANADLQAALANAQQQTTAGIANSNNYLQGAIALPGIAQGFQNLDMNDASTRLAIAQAMQGQLPTGTGVEGNTPTVGANPTDVAGITNQQNQLTLAQQGQDIANRNAQLGILGQLGGAGLMALAMSDPRLKTDIAPLRRDTSGRQWYTYRYHWAPELHVGVMADEVRRTDPDAVIELPSGYLAVDYSKLH